MTIEERMNRLEQTLGANDAMVRELHDAVTVTSQLVARQSTALREHAVWLVEHDTAMREHDARMREHDERMKTLDQRIANLVSSFCEFMRRERPEN